MIDNEGVAALPTNSVPASNRTRFRQFPGYRSVMCLGYSSPNSIVSIKQISHWYVRGDQRVGDVGEGESEREREISVVTLIVPDPSKSPGLILHPVT